MDPYSSNPRINGEIFNSNIRQGELEELGNKLDGNPSLVYLRAPISVRGMGKSAVVVHEWKRRKQFSDITSIYIKVASTHTVSDFTINIIRSWHEGGYLWNVLLDLLKKHLEDNPDPALSADVVEDIIISNPKLPYRINLSRYVYKGTISAVLRKLTEWVSNQNKALLPEIAELLFEEYLSKPSNFMTAYCNIKRKLRGYDEIDFFRSIVELTKLSRYKHHFIFLDQFEYVMTSKGKGKNIIEFCSDMRRFLESGLGFVTLCVTMHLDASNLLGTPLCSSLTEVAPRGPRYVVDIRELNAEQACELSRTYLEHYRNKEPPDPFYPFDKEAIRYIKDETSGNTRWILRALHFAIEQGQQEGFAPISKNFILTNHEAILQRARIEE